MGKVERAELLTSQIDEALEDLEYQLSQGHTQEFLDILDYYAKHFHAYSITNLMLIRAQKPTATRCAGYKQWEKLGCQVRQGEKAIYVRAPWLRKEVDQETGEKTEKLIGYLAVPVFDASQVDGTDKLPSPRHPLEGDFVPLYMMAQLATIGAGIAFEECQLPFGVHGLSSGRRIAISSTLSTAEKFVTLLHEACHEVLHKGEDRVKLSQRELEAESASYCLARYFGTDNPFSRDYILNYRGTVEGLQASFSRIHRAVKEIVSWFELEEEPAIAAD
jgi:hypothetical protein